MKVLKFGLMKNYVINICIKNNLEVQMGCFFMSLCVNIKKIKKNLNNIKLSAKG